MRTLKISLILLGGILAGCSETTEDTGSPNGGADIPITPVECITDSECESKLGPGACELARCQEGACQLAPRPAGSICEAEGLEVGECEVGRCDGAGTCGAEAAVDGQPCGVSDACNRQVCEAGQCIDDEPTACWDGNPCTDDTCDPVTGCLFANNTAACEDGNPCTTGDACSEGFCLSGENGCECFSDADCDGLDTDLCDGKLVCEANKCVNDDSTAVTCTPPDGLGQCETFGCEPSTGQCVVTVNNLAPCDDGNACTEGDFCAQNGNCLPGNEVTCEFNCGDGKDEDGDLLPDCLDIEDCGSSPACTDGE